MERPKFPDSRLDELIAAWKLFAKSHALTGDRVRERNADDTVSVLQDYKRARGRKP